MAELELEHSQEAPNPSYPTYDVQQFREGKPCFRVTQHWGTARACSIPAHLAPGLVLLLHSSTELSPQSLAVTQLLPSLPVLALGGGRL